MLTPKAMYCALIDTAPSPRCPLMDAELYRGCLIWGHAIRQGDGYAASGTITRNNKLVETSGVLGQF